MLNKATEQIKESIAILTSLGEEELVSDLLCALAAIDNLVSPRPDLTYSSVMRKLRQKDESSVKQFQLAFKKAFEKALDNDLDEPEQLALMEALQVVDVEV